MSGFLSRLKSVPGIIACGGLGAFAGVGLIELTGLSGVLGAIVAAAVGMVVATVAWIVGVIVLRSLGMLR